MARAAAVLSGLVGVAAAHEENVMNKGGIPYSVSNPPGSTPTWVGDPGEYSTDFSQNVKGPVEHFDVYGEVRTRYSQVYWTRNTPINLPPDLVKRFEGKVMAITGYEIDQVVHPGPQTGSTTKGGVLGGFSCYPSCDEGDKSVPIYHQYNHHYFSWLVGKDAEVYEREEPLHVPHPTWTGIRTKHGANAKFPTNIVFKENPGGEFRKSYHGYPSGYAQLIASPSQWIVEPMQIDTHNRKHNITDAAGYEPGFLPKIQQSNMTDFSSRLSPLIECPCSDRISKTEVKLPAIQSEGVCSTPITSLEECKSAAAFAEVVSASTVRDDSLPAGCLLLPTPKAGFKVVFNEATSTAASCDMGSSTTSKLLGEANLGGLTNLSLAIEGDEVRIILTGPADVWFGVGFNAGTMADQPYAVIVEAGAGVSERKLGNHQPGSLLEPSVTLVHDSSVGGKRTVELTRPVAGKTSKHYTFPTTAGSVNVITAVGNTPALAYHQARTSANIVLVPEKGSCVCEPKTQGYVTYMGKSRDLYDVTCFDEPRSDMLRHGDGTGRNVSNAACNVMTYHGGLHCCKHTWFLTDQDQDHLIPPAVDVYFLKWRYYFQEFVPATPNTRASHRHLHHWVFLIDMNINDYEEDNAHYGHKSIGKITAHLQAKDMGLEDVPPSFTYITPLVMSPHMHAPSGMREEIWNADTGEIMCNVTAQYGHERHGGLGDVFNEANYIAISPCIFGHQPGLQKPFSFTPATNITAIKYFNNTYRHLGQMAQWTGLMVYDTDPYLSDDDVFI
eukprot:TRINITY_DN15429_c0_g1_i1.p1 TRINITY_DN15429_c0_g1~~TRINITY_DN15429_c0_g1_i1.p1  ORF type:complete len:781 (+),score=127.63 TRINITY_DN15429_c0_g1_i1:66-2408(+)